WSIHAYSLCPLIRHACLSSRRQRPPSSTLFPYTTLFRSAMKSNRIALSWIGPVVLVAGSVTAGDRVDMQIRLTLVDSCVIHADRSEEHTSELQSRENLVCRLLLEKKKKHET